MKRILFTFSTRDEGMSGLQMKIHKNKKIRAQEKDKQVAYVQRATFPEAMSTEYLQLKTTNH